jgi:RimJ/RimL family protein N-acetyltransferase
MNFSRNFQRNAAQQQGQQQQGQSSLLQQVPEILESQHIKCIHHTPASAQKLHETYGFFANGREMSHEVEQQLFDAFIDDDYDGRLHLSTLHSYPEYQPDKDNNLNIGPPMGLVFWREVPDEEMKEWFDWNRVMRALASSTKYEDRKGIHRGEDSVISSSASAKKRKFHLVRQNSVESIQSMIESLHLSSSELKENAKSAEKELVHAWIKLELIAVRECYWGRHLGSLLLACALYNAHNQYDQSRVVLHIAGGEENIPAVKLYERFGFLPIQQGTVFHKPDKYMYVLGDIRYALGHTRWTGQTIEAVPISEEEEEDADDGQNVRDGTCER